MTALPSRQRRLTTTLRPEEFPPIYAMQCDGACMEPVLRDGSKLHFSRDEPYQVGDYVAVIRRPEYVRPGDHQIIIKRLVLSPGPAYWQPGWLNRSGLAPTVIVEQINPRTLLYFDPSHLLGMHKCLGEIDPERVGALIGDDEVRRLYPQAKALIAAE